MLPVELSANRFSSTDSTSRLDSCRTEGGSSRKRLFDKSRYRRLCSLNTSSGKTVRLLLLRTRRSRAGVCERVLASRQMHGSPTFSHIRLTHLKSSLEESINSRKRFPARVASDR